VKPENGETFSDILKTIKEKVDISSIGSEVSSIKESRSGGILIRLRREDKNRDELVEALKTNLGRCDNTRKEGPYQDWLDKRQCEIKGNRHQTLQMPWIRAHHSYVQGPGSGQGLQPLYE